MRLLVGVALGFALAAPAAHAQTPLEIGKSYRIESRVLNETRVIDVSLPAGYETDTNRRYPVVFVLDGEHEHEAAAAVARFYATMSQLPGLIVVGVRNTDRMRDMTPTAVAGFRVPAAAQNPGGADRFLTFFADELIPYIDRSYRTAPLRVLVGHSLGGLFTLYALGQRPELFLGYVVMEPAIWWNNHKEFRDAGTALRRPSGRRARVMLVNTESLGIDTTQWGGGGPMVRHLETHGETHGSMALAGMMGGLRTMFADFRPAEWRPGMRPVEVLDRYDSLAARVGFAPPIPEDAYALAIRMSIDSRHFDDAARALDRMERALGPSPRSRDLHTKLATDRAKPKPASFIPLEVPARRPSPREAAAFLGRWVSDSHDLEIRAAGDTIIVHDRIQYRNGDWYEGDDPVVQLTSTGTLEWGLPWFRGLAALVVLKGQIQADGSMVVTREPRGWVPQQGGPEMNRTQRFRRAP